MQARIKRMATEAEVNASSIRSHKNVSGEIFVGKYCANYLEGVNQNFLWKCTPRELAIARYHGLFQGDCNVLQVLAKDGKLDIINRIFGMCDIHLHAPFTRNNIRAIARTNMRNSKTEYERQVLGIKPTPELVNETKDYMAGKYGDMNPPIDPPLKPLGEWIPPKETFLARIRAWLDVWQRYKDSVGDLKQAEALSDQRWEKLQMTERAFISVARPRYMNNSLPQNDRDLYEALCDFHGEEKLDEVPF